MRRFLAGFVVLTVPLLAQESGGTQKPSMMLWQILNFLILAGLLGWLAAKHGGPLLANRSKEIEEGLAAGELAKAAADSHAAEVDRKLGSLEKEVAALRSSAREEREQEADRIRRDTQAEIARIHHQAEQEIESSGKQARIEVQRAAARLAVELAEQKVRAHMTPEIQAALLQGFVSDLSRDGVARAISPSD
jgi:F-type H+-transporting ATPase subunit b